MDKRALLELVNLINFHEVKSSGYCLGCARFISFEESFTHLTRIAEKAGFQEVVHTGDYIRADRVRI